MDNLTPSLLVPLVVYILIFAIICSIFGTINYWVFEKLKFKKNRKEKAFLYTAILFAVFVIVHLLGKPIFGSSDWKIIQLPFQLILPFLSLKWIYREDNKKSFQGFLCSLIFPIVVLMLLPLLLLFLSP